MCAATRHSTSDVPHHCCDNGSLSLQGGVEWLLTTAFMGGITTDDYPFNYEDLMQHERQCRAKYMWVYIFSVSIEYSHFSLPSDVHCILQCVEVNMTWLGLLSPRSDPALKLKSNHKWPMLMQDLNTFYDGFRSDQSGYIQRWPGTQVSMFLL